MYMCTYHYHYLLKLLAENNSTDILHQGETLMAKKLSAGILLLSARYKLTKTSADFCSSE